LGNPVHVRLTSVPRRPLRSSRDITAEMRERGASSVRENARADRRCADPAIWATRHVVLAHLSKARSLAYPGRTSIMRGRC
jgi:hypothetical protein